MQEEEISRADQMRHHITACQVSGQYVERYCKEQNLNPATYYYWRKKLHTSSNTHTGAFIELQPIQQTSCVEIVFANGVRIHFERLVPVDYLKQLVS